MITHLIIFLVALIIGLIIGFGCGVIFAGVKFFKKMEKKLEGILKNPIDAILGGSDDSEEEKE